MDILKQLLGRLHPLVVHLPIGFILLGLFLLWVDRKKKSYTNFYPIPFLWGGYVSALACITGYSQYLGEGYVFNTVKWHLWLGIATMLFSFVLYGRLKPIKKLRKIPMPAAAIVFLIVISFTGHEGGNITHGSDYLIEPLPNSIKKALGVPVFEEQQITLTDKNWQEAQLYEDVIAPILNNKCVSCHSPKKVKGGLLLHTPEAIAIGGENGSVLDKEENKLFVRMKLPTTNDKHMPPDGKTQPTKAEVTLIGEWTNLGAPFTGTIAESGLDKKFFTSFFPTIETYDYPSKTIAPLPLSEIKKLNANKIYVEKINETTNYVSVSCINKPDFTNTDFNQILAIKDQIAILDLGGTQITDSIFAKTATLSNLTILKLDNTSITGHNIEALTALQYLKTINLTATNFQESYIPHLKKFKKLKKVFLYSTPIKKQGIEMGNNAQLQLYYGNYSLPKLETDTIVY